MDFLIKENLDSIEHNKVIEFLSSLDFYCIEQHPDWNVKIDRYSQIFFICIDDEKRIKCFANIILSKGPIKTATINFGPAFEDYKLLQESLQFLHNYFTTEGFAYLSLQLGIETNPQVELLEYNIYKQFNINYNFKPENIWSSISIDLNRPETEILKSFSKGHRSAIKRGLKIGLRTSTKNSIEDLHVFIKLYIKMFEHRGLAIDSINAEYQLKSINAFLYNTKQGFFEYIFEREKMVGGLIIIFQGKTARYFKGAADPERRDVPSLHFGLFEAMKSCKEFGLSSLDLWGYNHFANENDQIFYINRFKKGFSGDFIFFPKRMNFILRPISYKIFKLLKYSKNKIKAIARN